MKKVVEMATYYCDRCGTRLEDAYGNVGFIDEDIFEVGDSQDGHGWKEIDGKHYCPDCIEIDEETDEYRPKPEKR